ncbi:hypothetical protein [Planomonospora sp. ID82291]|uniref:hypothetical protein n=1 Tax=Planomonospora sp. ID82291 TaxID=2738136 RepID=UPI0018C431B3|nr:hypothetical protein [Planomonospora sp. ID82291]MBG0819147.1 hypothetical protein [Planomonospora sp. ID82291]
MSSLTPIAAETVNPDPTATALRLATQAGNYARALKAGVPHDRREAESILKDARLLVETLQARELQGDS